MCSRRSVSFFSLFPFPDCDARYLFPSFREIKSTPSKLFIVSTPLFTYLFPPRFPAPSGSLPLPRSMATRVSHFAFRMRFVARPMSLVSHFPLRCHATDSRALFSPSFFKRSLRTHFSPCRRPPPLLATVVDRSSLLKTFFFFLDRVRPSVTSTRVSAPPIHAHRCSDPCAVLFCGQSPLHSAAVTLSPKRLFPFRAGGRFWSAGSLLRRLSTQPYPDAAFFSPERKAGADPLRWFSFFDRVFFRSYPFFVPFACCEFVTTAKPMGFSPLFLSIFLTWRWVFGTQRFPSLKTRMTSSYGRLTGRLQSFRFFFLMPDFKFFCWWSSIHCDQPLRTVRMAPTECFPPSTIFFMRSLGLLGPFNPFRLCFAVHVLEAFSIV